MSALPDDVVQLATHMLASDHMRRHAAGLCVDQIIAMAARLWELDQVASATGRYLAAQSADRAAFLFVSEPVSTAHDALAEALEELGYITIKEDLDHAD